MDSELSELDKQIGFDTWRHIWNLQRLVGSCIPEFDQSREQTKKYVAEMIGDEPISVKLSVVPEDKKITALSMLVISIQNVLINEARVPCHIELDEVEKDWIDGHATTSSFERITNNTVRVLTNLLQSLDNTEMRTADYIYTHIIHHFTQRMLTHDQSKLNVVEARYFTEFTPKLGHIKFGSPEYQACLVGLKPALDNHYAMNRHHPEHYGEEGAGAMTWFDVTEMACDWYASSLRTASGNPHGSVDHCTKRFSLSPALSMILHNTMDFLEPTAQIPQEAYLRQEGIGLA